MYSNGVVRSSSPPAPHDGIRKVRTVLRLFLVLVVFGGCVFLYVMIPTNTYKTIWMPRIRAAANSNPYFGSQGTQHNRKPSVDYFCMLQSLRIEDQTLNCVCLFMQVQIFWYSHFPLCSLLRWLVCISI